MREQDDLARKLGQILCLEAENQVLEDLTGAGS